MVCGEALEILRVEMSRTGLQRGNPHCTVECRGFLTQQIVAEHVCGEHLAEMGFLGGDAANGLHLELAVRDGSDEVGAHGPDGGQPVYPDEPANAGIEDRDIDGRERAGEGDAGGRGRGVERVRMQMEEVVARMVGKGAAELGLDEIGFHGGPRGEVEVEWPIAM